MGFLDGYVSGSSLQKAEACPGASALPGWGRSSEKADVGSAFHDHARDRTLHTPDDAARMLPEHAARWGLDETQTSILQARARNWEWQPPPGTMSEVGLGLLADGSVVRVKGGRGKYEGPPTMRVATRIDFFWAEPHPLRPGDPPRCPPGSILWGIDLKTGVDTWVAPIEKNLQALTAAVLPALWTGARSAVPAIVFPTRGPGTWDALAAPLDETGIKRARDLLLSVANRANAERAKYAEGKPLTLIEGAHCTWCDSIAYCPTKIATLKHYLGNPQPFAGVALTEDELVRLAQLSPLFDRFAASVKAALTHGVVQLGRPIPLGDGNVWGPYPKPKKVLEPFIAMHALAAVVGEPRAKQALKISMSDKAMSKAVKELHEATGVERQGAPTMRAIYRDIHLAGGVGSKTQINWGPHKPEDLPALPSAEVLALTIDADGVIDGDDDDDGQ